MKREFVINRQGKDYVLYAGLLDEAHQQGLSAIKTQLLQAPTPQNGHVAICSAEVTTERGTFTGLGDADPGNVNRVMANALIRLAETRAKARALRDAVNVGMIAIEELAENAADSLLADAAGPDAAPRDLAAPPEPPARIVSLPTVRQALRESAAGPAGPGDAPGAAGAGDSSAGAAALPAGVPPPAPAAPRPLTARGARPTGGAGGRGPAERAAPASEGPPLPATPTQLETIAKLARSVGRAVPTEDLTRAAASELITRLSEERYGSRRQ